MSVIETPDLLNVQIDSFNKFLQSDTPPHRRKKMGLQQVFEMIETVAKTDTTVMLRGERCTGKELIAHARQRPGDINYGSSGAGSTPHLSAELFQYMTGAKITHVPYKGSGAGMVALLSGEISMYFANIPVAIQHVRNNRLRPIALSGTRRNQAVPGIPTLSESGLPGFDVTSWFGIAAPAKTPPAIISAVNREITRLLALPEVKEAYARVGAEPRTSTPDAFAAQIKSEMNKWAAGPCPYRVIRTAQSSPACDGQRRTVYRLGVPEDTARATENTL